MDSKFSGSELEETTRLLDLVDSDGNPLQEKDALENFGSFAGHVMIIGARFWAVVPFSRSLSSVRHSIALRSSKRCDLIHTLIVEW